MYSMNKILCVGPIWQGSNAGALFRGFQKLNHIVTIIDENYFISLNSLGRLGKLIAKISREHQISQFNDVIINKAKSFKPDLIIIYKGAFILPKTISKLKALHVPVVNFFPDVSFFVHGNLITKSLPLYDYIFTTKTFGINDLKQKFNLSNTGFIPHGFDEDLHYPHSYGKHDFTDFECEVSFIGDRDNKKENILSSVVEKFPTLRLNIWGLPWVHSEVMNLERAVKGESIFGDLYPIGIQSSKINLGLLSEVRPGASSGDLITSRTFHIPACGGFMIHERTPDVLQFFEEGIEIECFSEVVELNEKIQFYLKNEKSREKISRKGYERCQKEHNLKFRAQQIVETLIEQNFLKD